MGILIDVEPVKTLITQPDTYSQVAKNPGFDLYWHSLGRDPLQAALGLAMGDNSGRAAALDQSGPDKKSVLNSLGRISGVSIEQQVSRHLPEEFNIDAHVVFVPGADLPLAAEGRVVAINVFALEQRANKLFLEDFPLLSLLANRIHRLCTVAWSPVLSTATCTRVISNFLHDMLREGSATLFFTMPVTGPVYQLWQKAEEQRDSQVNTLRRFILTQDGDAAPLALAREMEQSLGLIEPAALAAKYPLGTWMCQVIESAFGRSRLVELLQQPDSFLSVFEQARNKFGLAEKYSLEVS